MLYLLNANIRRITAAVVVLSVFLLVYARYSGTLNDSGMRAGYSVIMLAAALSFAAAWYMLYLKKASLEAVFLCLSIVLGFVYMFIMPPPTSPDEEAHIMTAYRYSNMILSKEPNSIRDADIALANLNPVPGAEDYRASFRNLFGTVKNNQIIEYKLTHVNTPFFMYLFSGLGIAAARLLNLTFEGLLFTGALFNFVFYTVMAYFAIKVMPCCKHMLFCVALFPVTLQQATSFSYDAVINGLAFFVTAHILKLVFEAEAVTVKNVAVGAVCAALLSMCKGGVYFPLCLMSLCIPRGTDNKGVKKAPIRYAGIIISVFAAVAFAVTVVSSMSEVMLDPGQETARESGRELSYIFSNPAGFLEIVFNTARDFGFHYLYSGIGGAMAYGYSVSGLMIPLWAIMLILLLTVVAALYSSGSGKEPDVKRRLMCALFSFMCLGMIFVVFFVAYTPANLQIIPGIQGRYFIAFYPLLFTALAGGLRRTKKRDREGAVIGATDIGAEIILVMCLLQSVCVSAVYCNVAGR